MGRSLQFVASAVISLSLVASSTAAVASTATPPAPTSNSWLTLSMLTPTGAAVLGETGVAAAQDAQDMPPPPPPASDYAGPGTPPIPVILIWLAVLGVDIYLLTRHHHHFHHANSPL